MKKGITLLLIILFALFCIKKATGQIKFNADEEHFASAFVDPTFSDKGFQFGVSYLMEYNSVYSEYSISHYNALEPSYTDLVVGYGVVLNIGKADLYTGGRIGFVYREKDNFAYLFGGSIRLQYPITDKIHLGLQGWLDMRSDLGNDLIRENGAIFLSIKL